MRFLVLVQSRDVPDVGPEGSVERLSFESRLRASPERLWAWATSVAGIRAELRPLAGMTIPPGVESILDLDVELGRPLARSRLLLFGFLPIDRVDLTLVELEEGRRFVEQSPVGSMRLWRHERSLEPVPGGCLLADRLTFEPRWARGPVRALVGALFRHRHRVLRREFGELAD